MFHYVLCIVCLSPVYCVSHIVSDSEHSESLTT
jgi:hypothetical protein